MGDPTDLAAVPPIRVLLVEDHAMVAEGLIAVLAEEDDITVVGQATTVAGCLAEIEASDPDVVLMDYRLPDGTGAEATAALKERASEVEIVILTASSEPDVVAACLEAGAAAFVSKSANIAEVAAAVRAAHAGEAVFTPELLGSLVAHLRRPSQPAPPVLSPRELEVLALLADGASTDAIVAALFISRHTARNHVRSILNKLGAHSKLEAVTIAAREGLVSIGGPR